jgi:hypothetical protein
MKIEIETYPATNRSEATNLLKELKEKFNNIIMKIRIIEEF